MLYMFSFFFVFYCSISRQLFFILQFHFRRCFWRGATTHPCYDGRSIARSSPQQLMNAHSKRHLRTTIWLILFRREQNRTIHMQQYSNWSTCRFIIVAFFSSHFIIVQTVMPHKWQKKVVINGINEAKKPKQREIHSEYGTSSRHC